MLTEEQKAEVGTSVIVACSSDTRTFDEFLSKLEIQHRTLQQNFTRLCIEWFLWLSKQDEFDMRNAASVEFAKSIKNQLSRADIPYI